MWSISSKAAIAKQKEVDAEQLHRKRVAQILRYIATMQTTGATGAAGLQFSFVRTLDDPTHSQRHGPFFQDASPATLDEDVGGGQVLFTLFDFQRLASISTDDRTQLPFSFYTARSNNNTNHNNNSSNGPRQFLTRRDGTATSDSCWLRLTRLTGADVPIPPPVSPPIVAFLQSRLGQDRSIARLATMPPSSSATLQLLETLLPWDQLRKPIPTSASPKVQRWWRRYTSYRKFLLLQRQIEPLYNHLFEWYHQTQEASSMGSTGGGGDTLDLIWGLGQAQKRVRDVVIDGPLLEVRVEVELARDGALLVRPKEHAGVTLNRQVLAAISSSTSTITTNNTTTNTSTTATTDDADAKNASSGESMTVRQLRQIVEGMNASDLSPGEPSSYIALLKRMAVELSSGGTFQSSSNHKKSKRLESLLQQGLLVVTDAWCLYSSPRPTAVWARDAWIFAEKLSMMTVNSKSIPMVIPLALKALTLGPGALDEKQSSNHSKNDTQLSSSSPSLAMVLGGWFQKVQQQQQPKESEIPAIPSSRPPFPLPTSDAQNRIAELLMNRNYPAVVCEGPPGTGKTHTIANIVCAYLCQGKRVLVTSKGAPALSVLRERLPECVQELCVDVSRSESSGMRQLQQTVERLANKVAWVNTDRELNKAKALQENIQELEEELCAIDKRLELHAQRRREMVQSQKGQEFFEHGLELIDTAPWLMKTISTWDLNRLESFCKDIKALIVIQDDPMALVDGFESPPSDALISLVAAKAGLALSYLKNATKEALAKVPILGNRLAEHCSHVQTQLESIRVDGNHPRSENKRDWYLVLERLQRDKAIHAFCHDTLDPLFGREGWPKDRFIHVVGNKNYIREEIIPVLEKALKMRQIGERVDVVTKRNEAIEIEKLDKRRAELTSRIQSVAEELVAARVVAELSKNFSAEAQSALVKFAQVSGKAKFGKSTPSSKMTQRQRRKRLEYLDAFEKCVRYIPCWILTSSQISDYLPSECLFDLVVIDEASQSDITVLPGMLRGRQWLIVGDGKQVSPTESFVAEEQIEMLKSAMPESPFEASMLPGHSFFDLCAQAFPMGRIILREHFRCAPEIISYSNAEFYNENLIPLRLPTSEERLSPSLIDIFVPDGRKVGKINERECDEIVKQIGEYVDNCGLLRKRSIGVISLVGEEQSRLIRGRLLDRVGPHKYKLHNILVGEPPSFQGAERDIVFLSMVCSPGSVVTQSQLMHAQRVNVALSRARDRMVLVRSIDLNHIPNEQDVKFSVLNFFACAKHISTEVDVHNDSRKLSSSLIFRVRAEQLLVKLLDEEGFATRSMGVVWDNAICVEDSAGSSGRRAGICVEATGETMEDWKAMLEQQKSIERVGWRCLRVDALSFLANHSEVFGIVKKFLASVKVFPTKKMQETTIKPAALFQAGGLPDDGEMSEDDDMDQPDVQDDQPVPVGPPPPQEEMVVISSDEENDDDDGKPLAMPLFGLKQEPVDMDRLGNGESAADYGNVADIGFLGMDTPRNESDIQDDDDDDDDDSFIAAPIRSSDVALNSLGSGDHGRPLIHSTSTRDSDEVNSTIDDDGSGRVESGVSQVQRGVRQNRKRSSASGNNVFSVVETKRKRRQIVSTPQERKSTRRRGENRTVASRSTSRDNEDDSGNLFNNDENDQDLWEDEANQLDDSDDESHLQEMDV